MIRKIQLSHSYNDIICLKNLLLAWKEFVCGKKNKKDVQDFSLRLMDNIFLLHHELSNHTWKHGGYQAFKINDPKPRDIHKAEVKDRLLHHAIYRILYPFFDKTFVADSYSCRNSKGTHKAIDKFQKYFYKVSKNNTKTCYVLKCDIKKFFANIDHEILIGIIKKYIPNENIVELLKKVASSFNTSPYPLLEKERGKTGVGLPLGNLTSQLFVNIYMNKFDQFMKHKLKIRYYIRYADDFVILSKDRKELEELVELIRIFLRNELKLELHPNKISIETFSSGVDFLGMVNFINHKILRTKTKRRMFGKIQNKKDDLKSGIISEESFSQSLQSYLGMLEYCESKGIENKIRNLIFEK